MNNAIPSSPYVGLRPFREEEFALFFGRDRESRVIASNLHARPLTVLYGSSGVGKSSVLQAGVVRRLKQEPDTTVLYFRDWQSNSRLRTILDSAYQFLPSSNKGSPPKAEQSGPANGQHAYLLLDQFEEYLLYHDNDSLAEEFDSALSRIVNRKDCPVNVLIGIRDDSLFKLDRRFSLRIPNLLRDTLELQRMTPTGAKDAIEKPLKKFSEISGENNVYSIEPALVDEICRQVLAGNVLMGDSSGIGAKNDPRKEGRIETAYLQLVLTKLWDAEHRLNSSVLRLQTLQKLGGADRIVRNHVNTVMNQLASERDRDIAWNMLSYLVTPSRSKIAQTTADLVSFAERPEPEVKAVLDELTNRSESRILRKLSDPEQYEIFHDVLAQPLLDWRRERAAAKDRRRLWRYIIGTVAVAVLFGLLAAYAFRERRLAANAYAQSNQTAGRLDQLLHDQQTTLRALQEAQEKGHGNETQVAQLQRQLLKYSTEAQNITQNYQAQQQSLDASSKLAADNLRRTTAERDAAQKDRDSYKDQLEKALQQIKDQQAKPPANSQQQGPAQQKQAPRSVEPPSGGTGNPPTPMGLQATVDSGGSRHSAEPSTITAGTELCGAASISHDVPLMLTFKPRALAARGKVVPVVGQPTANNLLRAEFDTLRYWTDDMNLAADVPISARVTSATSRDKNHPATVDSDGNIAGLESPSFKRISHVCITLTKDVSLTASAK